MVTLKLNAGAFKYYSEAKKGWVLEPGKFDVLVGAASNDIKLKSNLVL